MIRWAFVVLAHLGGAYDVPVQHKPAASERLPRARMAPAFRIWRKDLERMERVPPWRDEWMDSSTVRLAGWAVLAGVRPLRWRSPRSPNLNYFFLFEFA